MSVHTHTHTHMYTHMCTHTHRHTTPIHAHEAWLLTTWSLKEPQRPLPDRGHRGICTTSCEQKTPRTGHCGSRRRRRVGRTGCWASLRGAQALDPGTVARVPATDGVVSLCWGAALPWTFQSSPGDPNVQPGLRITAWRLREACPFLHPGHLACQLLYRQTSAWSASLGASTRCLDGSRFALFIIVSCLVFREFMRHPGAAAPQSH